MRLGPWLLVVLLPELVASLEIEEAEDETAGCNTTELSFVPLKVSSKTSSWSVGLDLYHFPGRSRVPSRLFFDAHLQINLTDKDAKIYQGENCSTVIQQYNDDRRLFGLLQQFNLMRSKQMSPFDCTIIGIVTREPYTVRVRIWEVNYMRACAFVGAIILYLLSYSLVRNAVFFYTSGCAVGVMASLLIVGFTVYRFAPKKWFIGLPMLFGAWSFSFYSLYFMWKNFTSMVLRYQKFVAAYFATVLIISFAVCYRYGPPTDVRSHNLAQWALQLIAILVIYFSCQIDEIAFAVIAILLVWSCTKGWIFAVLSRLLPFFTGVWRIFFPRTRRLLTLEEYEREGEEETRKSLDELRAYCRSPKADSWKIISSVSNPRRFASFVEGSTGHLTDDEIGLYDREGSSLGELSDDSGEDEPLLEARDRRENEVDLARYRSFIHPSFASDGPSRSRSERSRRSYEVSDEMLRDRRKEVPRPGVDEHPHSAPMRRVQSSSSRTSRSGSGYNGLLMPVPKKVLSEQQPTVSSPSRRRRSDDQTCQFYGLTVQQAIIYKLLRHRGAERGSDYIGESERMIKHNIPEELFNAEEYDEDLARLAELDLIRETSIDGYWMCSPQQH